jgi:type IV pilus assembly protein PilO
MATIDLKQFGGQVSQQFQGLEGRHPGVWPLLPRLALLLVLFVALVAAGWGLYWRGLFDELEQGRKQEDALKVQYRDKLRQAVNLQALRKQKEEVTQYVSQLEKQLPSKAEMDALLSDINQAGVGRGARLQLFKPGQVVIRDYYAELPITVRVGGGYHDFGSFASDLANLPRIVTLNNLTIQQDKTGGLTMDATAKTFRYLDAEEIAAHRAAVAAAQAEANKKRGKR